MHYKAVLPILGFQETSEYELEQIDEIFYRFSSREAETPSFTLIQPAALRDDYVFDLPANAAQKLGLEREEDALVLNIMILDTPLEKSHINFIAPLVFNTANGKMGQIVLDSARYPHYGLADPLTNFLKETEENAS